MTQIRDKLKSRGVYVGINSEYKEFVSSFTGTLTSSAIGPFLQGKLANDDDYRAQKVKLEEVLERTYINGKLIVIVDDIERCDRSTAREYLFLIKEIATMRGCVSVFVTDYDMLNEVVSVKNTPKSSYDFLNKFFNYKIDLVDEEPKDILAFYDGFFNDSDAVFWIIYKILCKSPREWYNEVVTGLTAKLNKLEKDKNIIYSNDEDRKRSQQRHKEHEECCLKFNELMRNPRNVAKFYNVFRNHALQCGRYLQLSSFYDDVSKYIDSRNIGQVLYLISFTEVFLPSEYERLKKQGPHYIDPFYFGIETIDNVNKRLLVELAQGLIFGRYNEFGKLQGYIKEDIKKFIKCYLSGSTDLYQLINPFTSQEEEWLDAMSNRNDQLIKMHWEEMVSMVLQKIPNIEAGITDSWRNEKFRFLLEFAEEQVETGVWSSDKLFFLFDSEWKLDRYLSIGTGLMQTFWEHLNKSTAYSKPSRDVIENLCIFTSHYAYSRCDSLYLLAHYLIPLENADKSSVSKECLLASNKPLGQILVEFVKKFEGAIPGFSSSSEGWYDSFKRLETMIKDFLLSKGIAECPDVENDMTQMLDTAEELNCLEKVVEWMGGGEGKSLPLSNSEVGADNLDAFIKYFDKKADECATDRSEQHKIKKEFDSFFEKLREADGIDPTDYQIQTLHQLVSKIVISLGIQGIWYRRIILKISQRNK